MNIVLCSQILQARCSFKDNNLLSSHVVPVFQGWNHALRMYRIEPLITGIDDGQSVWEAKLFGKNQGLDIINVGCLIGFQSVKLATLRGLCFGAPHL